MDQTLRNAFIEPAHFSFSDYFSSPLSARDIARGFGWSLFQTPATLPCADTQAFDLTWLQRSLTVNQRRARLENEMARRDALVAPVITEVCEIANLQYDTEYGIAVSPHLTGIVDYWLQAETTLLIVEAKQSDFVRGFKQLVPELIAAHHWDQGAKTLFGAVTDGERWQFTGLDLSQQHRPSLLQYNKVYQSSDLETLIGTLVAIAQPTLAGVGQ
jgi:hypothetical protein